MATIAASKEERFVVVEPCRQGLRIGYASVLDPRFYVVPIPGLKDISKLQAAVTDGFAIIEAGDQPVLLVLPMCASRTACIAFIRTIFEISKASHVGIVYRPTAAIAASGALSGYCLDTECPGTHISLTPVLDGLSCRIGCEEVKLESQDEQQSTNEDSDCSRSRTGNEPAGPPIYAIIEHVPCLALTSFMASGSAFVDRVLPVVVAIAETEEQAHAAEAAFLVGYRREPLMTESHVRMLEEVVTAGAGNVVIGEESGKPIHLRRAPDYLELYRGQSSLMPYLGACLLAKGLFGDPRTHQSREDFFAHGARDLFGCYTRRMA